MKQRTARLSETAFTALFFLAATAILTWPIAPRAANGLADLWDAKLNAWILHWDFHQFFRDPVHLYDANIFYPARYALAFSENLFGAAFFGFPLYAAGFSTLAVYNVVFLLGMFLSAMAAWALALEATGDALASIVAGLVYAFCPWRIAQIPHIQFQWGAFLALSLLFLLRYLDRGRLSDLILFGLCFAWNALCNVHYALFSGFLIVLVLTFEGLVAGWGAFRARLFGVVAAMAVASLAVLPFFIPYALASKLYGMSRGYEEITVFSGVWTDFLTAGGQNKLYAPLTQRWAKAEGELFPGLVPVALAVIAVSWRRRAERRPALRQAAPARRQVALILDALLLAALALWILALAGRTALGPLKTREPGRVAVVLTALLLLRLAVAFPRWSRFSDLGDFLRRLRPGTLPGLFLSIAILGVIVALGTHTPYYRFLVQSFGPMFRVIRAPSRGVVLFDLGLAVLAAWGLAELLRGRRRRERLAGAAVAVLMIGLEYRAFPVGVSPVDPRPSEAHAWLATLSFPGGVVEWPLGRWHDQEHEFRSTAHWKPILNGASGFAPPSYDDLAGTMEKRPLPDSIWPMLAEREATLLLFHPDQLEGEEVTAYGEALADGLSRGRIELVRSFPHGESRDFAFRLATAPQVQLPRLTGEELWRDRARLESLLHAPFGQVDLPAEGASVEPGSSGFGWALDDSGITRITVAIDEQSPRQAQVGLPHPGPAKLYPSYPDAAHAGFAFSIPEVPPGAHSLVLTIVAKDGGRMVIKRNIVVKGRH